MAECKMTVVAQGACSIRSNIIFEADAASETLGLTEWENMVVRTRHLHQRNRAELSEGSCSNVPIQPASAHRWWYQIHRLQSSSLLFHELMK